MIKRIIGLDPGKAGGIAWFDIEGDKIAHASAVKMPDTELGIAEQFLKITKKKNLDDETIAYIEQVHAMPSTKEIIDRQAAPNLCRQMTGAFDNKIVMALEAAGVGKRVQIIQGSVGTFSFGQGYGCLRGCLAMLQAMKLISRIESVRPQDWQAVNGCRTRGNKNISKEKAIQLFPGIKVTHYIADALLITNYGFKIYRSDNFLMRR